MAGELDCKHLVRNGEDHCEYCGEFVGYIISTLRSEVESLKGEVERLKGVIEVQRANWETEYEGRKSVEKAYNSRIDKLLTERDLARTERDEARKVLMTVWDSYMDVYSHAMDEQFKEMVKKFILFFSVNGKG